MKGTTKKNISQEKGLLNFLAPLTKAILHLIENALTQVAKNILVPLGLTAAASATDAAIQKNFLN